MLNYFLLLFLIAYMIFRFSKPPPSIDDYKKKKEPDVYNIEKIYMISSICFVICTIFIILQPFTLMVIPTYFIAFPTVFFGIFNTVMTVLFIKYRDDIYFFESYNLIFTLLVTFLGMYSIYNPLDKQLFQMMSCPTEETNHNNRTTVRTPGVDYDPSIPSHQPYILTSRPYIATDGYVSNGGRGAFSKHHDSEQKYPHEYNEHELQIGVHTLRKDLSRSDSAQTELEFPSYHALRRHTSLHQKHGLDSQETDTFNSHGQETFQNKLDR